MLGSGVTAYPPPQIAAALATPPCSEPLQPLLVFGVIKHGLITQFKFGLFNRRELRGSPLQAYHQMGPRRLHPTMLVSALSPAC